MQRNVITDISIFNFGQVYPESMLNNIIAMSIVTNVRRREERNIHVRLILSALAK